MKCPLSIRGKNRLWIAPILIIIAMVGAAMWSMSTVMVPVSAGFPAQAVWVDPNSYLTSPELDTLKTCDTFTVDVKINISLPLSANATGMFGWQYILFWNSDNIELTGYVTHLPNPNWAPPNGFLVAEEVGVWDSAAHGGDFPEEDGRDYHMYAYTSTKGTPFTGVVSLCTYEFHVIETVYEPSPDEIDTLRLKWVKFLDDKAKVIAMTKYNGEYRKCAQPVPPPVLKVEPAKVQGVCGEKFNMTIEIEFLNATFDMRRWNATLSYNTTMLDAQASWEGPFLDGFGDANYTDDISDTLGTVYMNGFFVSPPTNPPNGSGVLATVGFNATWQYNVSSTSLPPIGCSLSLYDTTLLNPVNATIDHTVVNATYNAPYKPEVLDHAIVFGGITYHVITESNSSVSPVPMNFNQSGKFVSFNVTGKSGYAGYCKVTIPRNFLNASCTATQRWQVWVDDVLISRTCTLNDADNNTLTFTYNFMSTTRTVKIVGFWVVPEFPIAMILPLLLMATLTAAILGKRVRSGKCRGSSVAE